MLIYWEVVLSCAFFPSCTSAFGWSSVLTVSQSFISLGSSRSKNIVRSFFLESISTVMPKHLRKSPSSCTLLYWAETSITSFKCEAWFCSRLSNMANVPCMRVGSSPLVLDDAVALRSCNTSEISGGERYGNFL